jgi:hypothetical protein
MPDGNDYAVASIDSATQLTLAAPYESVTFTGQSYTLTYNPDTANSHGSYARTTTWAAAEGDVLGGSNFDWKMYHNTQKIHNLDVEINKGRERIVDLVALKMRNQVRMLKRDLIQDFYAAQYDGGNSMVGLQAIVSKTGLVGGIQKRKYAWWQGYTADNSGSNRDLTWDLLNAAWYGTKHYGNADAATLIVTSEGVLQDYENKLSKVVPTGVAGTRYQNLQLNFPADKQRKVYDGGFAGFSFKGIPMIADPYLPVTNKLFFINERYIHWRVLKNFESTGWKQLRDQGQDYAQMTIFGYGALTASCCRKFGMISDLNEA